MNLTFWAALPQVQKQLQQLQHYLLKTVDLPNQPIHTKILKLLQSGGKFLRPGIFYLFSSLGPNPDEDQLLAGASAQELLHLAVQGHNQVSDDKLQSLNLGQDKHQRNAIYAGDYLFTRYFDEILKTKPSSAEFSDYLTAMQRILSGHLTQLQHQFDLTETVPDYFTEINQRTGDAFRFSAEQGARLAGAAPELIDLSAAIGASIGTAYQVHQDIVLTFGQPQSLLTSLQKGQYPLPIILILNQTEMQQVLKRRQQLTISDVKLIQKQLDQKAVQLQLTKLTDHINDLLNQLPAGTAQNDLRQFITRLFQA
ncbi:polyprenyl synthetase family protein [Secundilactobacillus hailunensis]|uniref:Polyprenyl synthetase family protein n=1 Tax=Secundilactobacillus hailunensis TaxID=2559923 RepID=A0ABW1TBS3_9LACO|nr:polyprenyl synthetase family protein [Secundilactobacillus hailunensis]